MKVSTIILVGFGFFAVNAYATTYSECVNSINKEYERYKDAIEDCHRVDPDAPADYDSEGATQACISEINEYFDPRGIGVEKLVQDALNSCNRYK